MLISLNTNELSNCSYQIDSNSQNIITSSNSLTHTMTINSPSNGNHIFYFYCSDSNLNLGTNSISLNVGVSSTGGGSSGGGSEDVIENKTNKTQIIDNLYLDKIQIDMMNNWSYIYDNKIIIKTLDQNNNSIKIDSINLEFNNSLLYFIKNESNNNYYQYIINVPFQNISISKINFKVVKDNITLEDSKYINIYDKNKVEDLTDKIKHSFPLLSKYFLYIVLSFFIILILLYLIKNKRK